MAPNTIRRNAMEWSEILQLKEWSPLSEISAKAAVVVDGILQVAPDGYIVTQPYNKLLEDNDPNAPFVTRAYWGGSVDAVRRRVDGDPTIGNTPPSSRPPPELLLGTNGTYGESVRKASALRDRFSEQARYSNTGKFLYKLISSGRFEYCFLDNEENDDEPTFLIQIALVKT